MNVPDIIKRNTYRTPPEPYATGRRANEAKYRSEVYNWLNNIGLSVTRAENGDIEAHNGDDITVRFHYTEYGDKVVKRFSVYNNGKKSNIKILIKWISNKKLKLSD